MPDNLDEISTEIEARLITVALSKYSVTPNSLLAGKEAITSREVWEVPEIGVIFYVTPQEFDIFSAELSVLANQIPAVHSSRQVSEIDKLEVTKFLLDRITKSKYFAEEDLQMLGRQRVQLAYRSE